jgi:hypothetical protein
VKAGGGRFFTVAGTVAVLVLVASPSSGAAGFQAAAGPSPRLAEFVLPGTPVVPPPATTLRRRYVVLPYHPRRSAAPSTSALAGPTVPMWKGSIVSHGSSYRYKMVGEDPFVTETNPATTVTTPIIPVRFQFSSDGSVFDPTAPDPTCSPAGTALKLTKNSPIFVSQPFLSGSKLVGNGQYVDEFQRANFWQQVKPSGINPGYGVNLSLVVEPLVSIVDSGDTTLSGNCGRLGLIDINAWDSYLQTTLFPALASEGVSTTTFPIFEFYNVVLYNGTTTNCCILGYHSAFDNPSFGGAFQSYAVADYDSSGLFDGDVSALSHEVAEWMDDPTTHNLTPSWGNIGQVTGCQNNMEVGDPLSGTTIAVTMPNGFTYHPQELAFFSWFFDQAPSIGVKGWYSSNGTFRTGAAAC